jgi:L-fuconate dehydratase
MTTIQSLSVRDIRFPTSRQLDGSDAMNVDPDYSCAYVVLGTDGRREGHGLTFTCGRGTEVVAEAIRAYAPFVVGRSLEEITRAFGDYWRSLMQESQMRWLGPEKGVTHLALGAVFNAIWDLWGKTEGKPVWKLVSDLSPERIVSLVDFHYLTDALTPGEALGILRKLAPTRRKREAEIRRIGYPAYTTSAGWLGYSKAKIRRLCREGVKAGWNHFKMKVGTDLKDDVRRLAIAREEIGPKRKLMVDANQRWDVAEAVRWMNELKRFDLWWIEEPTSPDDVLGHAAIARALAPLGVATGEACQNRVIFKQLFQANAVKFAQPDACRLGSVNEFLAVLLLAAKFGVPVCPHGGGVGLCEYVQHLSLIDYVCVSGSLEDRILEYVDHLHEHFKDPCVVRRGRYAVPTAPGYSAEMKPASLDAHEYPQGRVWRS